MAIRLYLDEDVDPLLAQVLRDRGVDCLSTHEANNRGLSDPDQMAFATAQGRAILTFNVKDFVPLAQKYSASGQHHTGIIVSDHLPFRDLLRRILSLLLDVEFAYLTGWRKTEVLTLLWRNVDFEAGTVRLDPGTTKNDEGRVFPFAVLPALADVLKRQHERTKGSRKLPAGSSPGYSTVMDPESETLEALGIKVVRQQAYPTRSCMISGAQPSETSSGQASPGPWP